MTTIFAQQPKSQLSWPEITPESKPWTRWWWPGSIVTSADLTANMEKYQKASLGGLELTVIYGVKGLENRFINYLTPKWMEMFTHTLKEGERLNMGIELANASGWPFGCSWVEPADACKNINYKTWSLKTGESLIHGAPANILDLYAAIDIPETEGTELTRFKFASSAGNVTGKKYISSESATWLNEHFSSSLSDVKKAVDLYFLSGINHIYYHGTCYSPLGQPWPGFQFYASVEFSPQNPFWNDFEELNKYVTRVQSFLQRGKPDNDILLYFPIYDRYSDYGGNLLEHFDAISPKFNRTPFRYSADSMLIKGYTYDYISDLQLKNTKTVNGLLQTIGGTYKTVIVPGSKYIPLETFEKILKLAEDGAQVIFYDGLPENISGWADIETKGKTYAKLKSDLNFNTTDNKNIKKAVFGKGSLFLGNDLEQLLSFAAISREKIVDMNINFSRRKFENGNYYFIANKGSTSFEGWLPLSRKAVSVTLLNP